jgi:hypothetical protein
MAVSNTGGHGRGGTQGRIIGDVINHGKHDLWGKPGVHYHHGMAAGQNTLNALCARVVMRGIAARGGVYSADGFLDDYVSAGGYSGGTMCKGVLCARGGYMGVLL